MKSAFVVLAFVALSGCAVHQQYTYFEPQGAAEPVSAPPQAPKNTLFFHLGKSLLQVDGRLVGQAGKINFWLTIPRGEQVHFLQTGVRLQQGPINEMVSPEWIGIRNENERARPTKVAFDTLLDGKSCARGRPKEGADGICSTVIVVPKSVSMTAPFVLIIPESDQSPSLTVTFTPKAADYWDWSYVRPQ